MRCSCSIQSHHCSGASRPGLKKNAWVSYLPASRLFGSWYNFTLTELDASGAGVMSGPAKTSGGGGTFLLGRASGRWALLITVAIILL